MNGAGSISGVPEQPPSERRSFRSTVVVIAVVAAIGSYWWTHRATPSDSQTTVTADAPAANNTQAPPPVLPVEVELTIDTSYPPAVLALLPALMNVIPPRVVTPTRQLSIPDASAQFYGITAANRPDVLAVLSPRLGRSTETPGPLPASPVNIPDLPRLTTNPQQSRRVITTTRDALAGSDWRAILDAANDPVHLQFQALQFKITPAHQGGAGAGTSGYVQPFDAAWLQKLANASRDTYVFVIDTGWPSEQAWTDSVAVLKGLFDRVVDVRKLTPRSMWGTYQGPPATHSAAIGESLAPLTALSSKVHVVYVPMSLNQGSSVPHELI